MFQNVILAKNWLRHNGVTVSSYRTLGRSYMIHIVSPCAELQKRAVEVMESFGGIKRRAYMARIQECWVIWR